MKGIPTAGTPVLDGPVMNRPWYDFFLDVAMRDSALPPFAVADLPEPTKDGQMAFCTDESGGAVPVFSLAGQWRRVTDRAVVS